MELALSQGRQPPNNSLEHTHPERGFMYDVAVLRRTARGRWAAQS